MACLYIFTKLIFKKAEILTGAWGDINKTLAFQDAKNILWY